VRDRYKEEYNKSNNYSARDQTAIIAALYITHVGHLAPVNFLSNVLSYDVGGAIDQLNTQDDPLRIVHRVGEVIRTIPAIGATNILDHVISDRDIVDTVVCILEYISELDNRDDFEKYVYAQMMRYSILRSVIQSDAEIERFFDNISKNGYFRRQTLFWLQWHMAKTDLNKFADAEKFLDQSYAEAAAYEKRTGNAYNLKQLDDRKAKFLMRRARYIDRDMGGLFRDFKAACEIAGHLFREFDLTHHPYETLKEISSSFNSLKHKFNPQQIVFFEKLIAGLIKLASNKLDGVPEGYQQNTAKNALSSSLEFIPDQH
jgi:hypothetical protein